MIKNRGKAAYLNKLTSQLNLKTIKVDENMDGTTPPDVLSSG